MSEAFKEVEDQMKQLNWFDKTQVNAKKRNMYPNIQFEEAMNYNKRFAEHLASKKNNNNNSS